MVPGTSAIELVKNGGQPRPYSPSTSSESSSSSEDSSGDSELFPPRNDQPTTTPLQFALRGIELHVKCLMRLSVVLRQPTPRDYQKKLALPENRMDHYIPHDINYVADKVRQIACYLYPPTATDEEKSTVGKFQAPEWLIERLGKANTQRRQLLRYLQRHREKIAKYVDAPLSEVKTFPEKDEDGDHDHLHEQDVFHQPPTLNMSMRTQTTVTTVHEVSRPIDNLNLEAIPEGCQTDTSFGTNTSWNDGVDTKVEVPPPPMSAELLIDRPFQACPL